MDSKTLSVLIADDETTVLEALTTVLTRLGYHVAGTARDGAEAVEMVRNIPADFLVLDISMPVMDGIQMMAAVRKLPGYGFTPMLMLTTESQAEKKDAGRKAGATGWIVKPFNAEQLIAVVQKLVK